MLSHKFDSKTNNAIAYWLVFWMFGVMLLIMALTHLSAKKAEEEAARAYEEAEEAEALVYVQTVDRFTGTDAREIFAPRDEERAAIIRVLCKKYPEDCEAEGLSLEDNDSAPNN